MTYLCKPNICLCEFFFVLQTRMCSSDTSTGHCPVAGLLPGYLSTDLITGLLGHGSFIHPTKYGLRVHCASNNLPGNMDPDQDELIINEKQPVGPIDMSVSSLGHVRSNNSTSNKKKSLFCVPSKSKHGGLERWFSGEEHLSLPSTHPWAVTPAPGFPGPLSGLCRHLQAYGSHERI